MDAGAIALMIPIFALFIPITAIKAKHQERMEEIRSRNSQPQTIVGDEALRAEVQQLKEQVMALRDTTTKFDLSFDSALDTMESRMKRVEERQLSQSYQITETGEPLARLRAEQ
jgi:hypothetical protein